MGGRDVAPDGLKKMARGGGEDGDGGENSKDKYGGNDGDGDGDGSRDDDTPILMSKGSLNQYFISGAGIDREVITTDIVRYLGEEALIKPGQLKVIITRNYKLTRTLLTRARIESKELMPYLRQDTSSQRTESLRL